MDEANKKNWKYRERLEERHANYQYVQLSVDTVAFMWIVLTFIELEKSFHKQWKHENMKHILRFRFS